MTDPTNTIGKLRAILQAMQVPHVFDPTRKAELVDTAEQAIIAWALEAVGEDEPKPEDVLHSDYDYSEVVARNKLRAEIRAKLTGGTE